MTNENILDLRVRLARRSEIYQFDGGVSGRTSVTFRYSDS